MSELTTKLDEHVHTDSVYRGALNKIKKIKISGGITGDPRDFG